MHRRPLLNKVHLKKGIPMKKFFLIAAAATMMTAAPAFASTLDINLGGALANQTQNGAVGQAAISAAVAVGNVGSATDVSSTAVNGAQMADVTNTVSQSASLLDGNATLTRVNQTVNGAIGQVGLSVAGSGSISDHASLSSTMANLGQNASIKVSVHQ